MTKLEKAIKNTYLGKASGKFIKYNTRKFEIMVGSFLPKNFFLATALTEKEEMKLSKNEFREIFFKGKKENFDIMKGDDGRFYTYGGSENNYKIWRLVEELSICYHQTYNL